MSRSVPRQPRSDQQFSRYSQKSLDTQTSHLKCRSQTPSNPPTKHNSNDKSLCQGIGAFITRGRHCLIALPWAKIVDIAMFKFNSAPSFTRKAPLKDTRAHVHDTYNHPVSITIENTPVFQISRNQRTRISHTCTLHHKSQHPKSCTIE